MSVCFFMLKVSQTTVSQHSFKNINSPCQRVSYFSSAVLNVLRLNNFFVPNRRAVRECDSLGGRLLVLKRGPNHDLPLRVKRASKSG